MSDPLVKITNLKKRFGALEVLKGVSISVTKGEVVSLIGASGSGKTTLLRCVNLLEEFEGGEILLDNEPLGYRLVGDRRKRLSDGALSKQRSKTGMVFQSFNLFPHMTAAQNIMLGLRKVQGIGKAEARAIAEEWLRRVNLAERADYHPSQLSGGQQQRVAIARALAMNPKLILLDEITSALDPELVQEVLETVKAIAEAGATLLIVTHEMRFAREVSSRVLFMADGRVEEEGPPAAIFGAPTSPRLRDFLRNMPGN